ncbi:MAG: ABC transporter ATP-binding protein [Phycisphaerales bacterium]|nr:ABC transporter ATP-binding protein [Phycisphaerales bacterium]
MHTPAAIQTSAPPQVAGPPPESRPIIRLVNVCKSFGPQVVLDHFSLELPTSKTTVLLGPSGSGKSVMLKHIVGLLRPDSGEVYFEDQRVDLLTEKQLRDVRLQVGLVFQMGALFDSMTVEENLAFPMIEHTRLTPAERRARISESLATVDLTGVEGKLPSQLSGGQRKRVALARAIVLKPKVMLYDEPTTGLDPIRADGINELIIKLQRTLGVTGVVVTHDLASARKVADRVVMLYGGRIIAEGTYDELEHSENPHVSHFFAGQYEQEDEPAAPGGGHGGDEGP